MSKIENLEAERSTLGCILVSPGNLEIIQKSLRPDHFSDPLNQEIYSHLLEMNRSGKEIDILILADSLKKKSIPFDYEYIDSLSYGIPKINNVEHYADIVVDKYLRRQLCAFADKVKDKAEKDDLIDLAGYLQLGHHRLTERINVSKLQGYLELKKQLYNDIVERSENPGKVDGVLIGYRDFDRLVNGLEAGDLIILAARPAMGKTGLGLNIALNVAKARPSVIMFSMEMIRDQLGYHLISLESGIPAKNLKTGYMDGHFDNLNNACAESWSDQNETLFIDDSSDMSIAEMKASVLEKKRETKVSLVIVDYLQLSKPENERDMRTVQVSKMSRSLKILAKECNVPVIALAQLSRACETRDNKRPVLSDLRESGTIEQDADMVCFLYRDEYYLEQAGKSKEGKEQLAELIIAKHRNGPTGVIELLFEKELVRFSDVEESKSERV